jgi:hypothetical protein
LIDAGAPSRMVTVQETVWPVEHVPEPDAAESTCRLLLTVSLTCTDTSVVLVVSTPILKVKRAPGDDSETDALLLIRTSPGTCVAVVVATGTVVLVGVAVSAPGTGVLVGVAVSAPGTGVLVGVAVSAPGTGVLVGVAVLAPGTGVLLGVAVSAGSVVAVFVAGMAVLVKPWATVGISSGSLLGAGSVVAAGSGVGALSGGGLGWFSGCAVDSSTGVGSVVIS